MALKQYKPNTPGQRGLVLVDKADLFKGKPIKKLTEGLNKSGGRNNSGKITILYKNLEQFELISKLLKQR